MFVIILLLLSCSSILMSSEKREALSTINYSIEKPNYRNHYICVHLTANENPNSLVTASAIWGDKLFDLSNSVLKSILCKLKTSKVYGDFMLVREKNETVFSEDGIEYLVEQKKYLVCRKHWEMLISELPHETLK